MYIILSINFEKPECIDMSRQFVINEVINFLIKNIPIVENEMFW